MLKTADMLQVEEILTQSMKTFMIGPTAHTAIKYLIQPSLIISTFAPITPRAGLWQKNMA
jgi:hypothetical protein